MQTTRALTLDPLAAHSVSVGERRVLFHIPTSSLFDLDPLSAELYDMLGAGPVQAGDLEARFDGRFAADAVVEAVEEFQALGLISGGRSGDRRRVTEARKHAPVTRFPLSTLVLNVTTGCNLSCSYCYKEDLTTPAKSRDMDLATAEKSVELLLEESAERKRVNLVFFGGEPLRRLDYIKSVVAYADRRAAEVGKEVDYSLTTNATLLSDAVIEYLDAHRFGVAISMDGPKIQHDKNRLTVGGKGSYDAIIGKVKRILEQYKSRPVGARVTLAAGNTDVEAIHAHLKDEIGFAEVGYAPVTAGDNALFNLTGDELQEVFAGFKRLGLSYRDAAIEGRSTGFSNLHQLMTDLHDGTRKALPCGAGVGMLAVDKDGGLNLCHRFTGSDMPLFGTLDDGIDKTRLGSFIDARLDKTGTGCETCRIRNLCAGGCYHESYARYGDPQHPTYHYCEIMRDWVDFGIEIYVDIMSKNPRFFDQYIAPRRGDRGLPLDSLARAPETMG
ncbi:quinohemoprotein amine dehydrogenase maturation protein [Govanella unica]|uniref:Quinohemoprotein amine dehydrogenase maturation protein n=1 Tax=Govanella unica TaxID=2975056 RepID=A0A9X3Z609_9PROT|nr:quinohemoprotein amine dehydrogenase maturation protein [Govania unica]MDA5192587.1 quinohemoprotein amine dehydrogenase maturation protein [Govania unica]